MLGLELEDVLARRLRQEAFVTWLARAGGDETGDAVLDELLHPAGEGARGHPDLNRASLDLLPQHDDGSDLFIGDLIGMEQHRLERLPLRRWQVCRPRAPAPRHSIPAFSLQLDSVPIRANHPPNAPQKGERLPV